MQPRPAAPEPAISGLFWTLSSVWRRIIQISARLSTGLGRSTLEGHKPRFLGRTSFLTLRGLRKDKDALIEFVVDKVVRGTVTVRGRQKPDAKVLFMSSTQGQVEIRTDSQVRYEVKGLTGSPSPS